MNFPLLTLHAVPTADGIHPPQASDLPSLANTGGSGAAGFEPRTAGRGVGSRQREEGLARPQRGGLTQDCRWLVVASAASKPLPLLSPASSRSGASCLDAVRPHFGRVNTDPELNTEQRAHRSPRSPGTSFCTRQTGPGLLLFQGSQNSKF